MKNKFIFLFFFICIALNQEIFSQKLAIKYNDGKCFVYDVNKMKQFSVCTNSFEDSLKKIALPNGLKFYNIKVEGNACCKVYDFFNKELIVRYCGISLLAKQRLVWSDKSLDCPSDCSISDNSIPCPQSQYIVLDYSKANEAILVEDRNTPMLSSRQGAIVEYNLNNGRKIVYKTNVFNLRYSLDGKYILMQSSRTKNQYFVLNKSTNAKPFSLNNVTEVFWLK